MDCYRRKYHSIYAYTNHADVTDRHRWVTVTVTVTVYGWESTHCCQYTIKVTVTVYLLQQHLNKGKTTTNSNPLSPSIPVLLIAQECSDTLIYTHAFAT